MSLPHTGSDLSRIYGQRFASNLEYRTRVWRVLIDSFFQKYVPRNATILDLGCGYGEFINQVAGSRKYAMDLNPDAPNYLSADVEFIRQDCSQPWPLPAGCLDVVFTSNFFEHLPDKAALGRTLDHIKHALKPGGLLIAMGPNIRCTGGAYWDFWDHYIPLTEKSLGEALENRGFKLEQCVARFLPYTMADKRRTPLLFIKLYFMVPSVWKLLGRQFLILSSKSSGRSADDLI